MYCLFLTMFSPHFFFSQAVYFFYGTKDCLVQECKDLNKKVEVSFLTCLFSGQSVECKNLTLWKTRRGALLFTIFTLMTFVWEWLWPWSIFVFLFHLPTWNSCLWAYWTFLVFFWPCLSSMSQALILIYNLHQRLT